MVTPKISKKLPLWMFVYFFKLSQSNWYIVLLFLIFTFSKFKFQMSNWGYIFGKLCHFPQFEINLLHFNKIFVNLWFCTIFKPERSLLRLLQISYEIPIIMDFLKNFKFFQEIFKILWKNSTRQKYHKCGFYSCFECKFDCYNSPPILLTMHP